MTAVAVTVVAIAQRSAPSGEAKCPPGAPAASGSPARVAVTPRSGPAGTLVILNAFGYLIGEPVEVHACMQSGRTLALGSRTANADGAVRGLPVRIDSAICCPGSAIRIRTTGRLSHVTAEVTFRIV